MFQIDNKKSYPSTITKWFVDSRLTQEQQGSFRSHFEITVKSQGETILVCVKLYVWAFNKPNLFFEIFCSTLLRLQNLIVTSTKRANVS